MSVTYGGISADAINDTSLSTAGPDEYGERGYSGGTLRWLASELAKPTDGAMIDVAGVNALAVSSRVDSCGVVVTVEYALQDEAA